jgi:hypothetical protein
MQGFPDGVKTSGVTGMSNLEHVKQHMDIIGADGVHVGTVDAVEGDRIRLTKVDGGAHGGHYHYLSGGLVAEVEGDRVRLSANGANAVLFEEEAGQDGGFGDRDG